MESVSKVYDHIFVNKYMLNSEYKSFYPDYDMAEYIRRLRTNDNIQKHDIILLKHQALEYDIMKSNPNITYYEAHLIAEKRYNYRKLYLSG